MVPDVIIQQERENFLKKSQEKEELEFQVEDMYYGIDPLEGLIVDTELLDFLKKEGTPLSIPWHDIYGTTSTVYSIEVDKLQEFINSRTVEV